MAITATTNARVEDSATPVRGRGSREPRPRTGRRRIFTSLTPWLFLAAAVGLLLMLTYWPALNLFYYSVTDWDGIDQTKNIVGLENYIEVFTNPEIFQVFFVSLYYFAATFVQIGLALYFATILSFSTRFQNMWRGIIFFPYLVNGVAIAFMFQYVFQQGGTLDIMLSWFGVTDPPMWLGDPAIANWSLASTSVWRYTGLNFVLFLGAIQSIPSELYEAAEIDGASKWQQFWTIIVPGIRRVVVLSLILAISGSLAAFETPFIITGGANGTATFVIKTVQEAFVFSHVGLASAMAVVLLIIVLLVTWIQRKLFPDEKVELS
ncbi:MULTISPECIES: carbohydrate ABC transporter permease [unclassified Microbacterium]|uniref:carbohydrate ABC transporter permease n=1 Tax=unclassified Microbacterium TaxID=2609290 RepID=UPI0012F8454C|nr:sugar ABC transporter permease [Microbacterium sp. MAH-37]MVQ40685.1 ABC transporter permease subunit [Microbacterium sp. MAH-37]